MKDPQLGNNVPNAALLLVSMVVMFLYMVQNSIHIVDETGIRSEDQGDLGLSPG